MASQMGGSRIAGVKDAVFGFGRRYTQVNPKPALPCMSQAGIASYAKWFGFIKEIPDMYKLYSDYRLEHGLGEVVQRAYGIMKQQEEIENQQRKNILPNNPEYYRDPDNCNYEKKIQRQLRIGLGMSPETPISEVRQVLENLN